MGNRMELVHTGEQALAAGDWESARAALGEALHEAETAEVLAGLSDALWWLGEIAEAIDHGERAYAAYRRRGEVARATELALWLSLRYDSNLGNEAAAAGWLARARGLVDEHGIDELRGWVRLYEISPADPRGSEALAREALELGRHHGDADLELCAMSELGAALVDQGRVDEGMTHLDEAMASSLAGECGGPTTVVYTSCTTLSSCTSRAAFERAQQWVRAVDGFTRRFGCPFLDVRCRTVYGAVLIAIGDWLQAEEELTLAVRGSQAALPAVHADALSQLAELRLAQGRIDEAERLVQGLDDHRAALPAIAAIQIERGRVASAEAMLRRWVAPLDEAGLLELVPHELLGEAELAQGEVERAAERGRALTDAGERLDCDIVVARGRRLLARAVASADADAARANLDAALVGFGGLGMPLEAGRTRVHLGRLLADHATEVAVDELRRALEVFEGLGAARDADRAAALLRELGVRAARVGPAGESLLTPREREVLGLLGEGMSNPEIAERLYISRRTVEHHVANVLVKLGVRSRGEAIAQAIRFRDTVPIRGS